MELADLIQCRDGVELPASGEWLVGPGQTLIAPKCRSGDRNPCLRTAAGRLTIPADPRLATFELELTSDRRWTARTVSYSGVLAGVDRYGRWEVRGTVATDESFTPSPLDLAVTYHGVYRHAASAITWLTVVWPTSEEPLRWHGRSGLRVLQGELIARKAPTERQLAARWGPPLGVEGRAQHPLAKRGGT